MNIDDIVNELMKENTPEFTKWSLNNTNTEEIKDTDKKYIDVHGVRILTVHLKSEKDNSIIDFILWIRLTTLKTETDEIHEFWIQSVLTPTEEQKKILDSMSNEDVLNMVNRLNTTYVSGTICAIEKQYFAYIQKVVLPKENSMDYIKDMIMYAVTRGVPMTVSSLNEYLFKSDKAMVKTNIINIAKTIENCGDYNYLMETEDNEEVQKFVTWFEKMCDAVYAASNMVIVDIKDVQISNFMLKKLISIFDNARHNYPKTVPMFYNSALSVDGLNNLYKDAMYKEMLKVFTLREVDKMSEDELRDFCIKYQNAVVECVTNLMQYSTNITQE